MKSDWIRFVTDCALAEQTPLYEGHTMCSALTLDAFKNNVELHICGTYNCPFYKQNKANIRTGKSERQPRRIR